jgi:leucyl aminopeptidase
MRVAVVSIRLSAARTPLAARSLPPALAVPVGPEATAPPPTQAVLPESLIDELTAFIDDSGHSGAAGVVKSLPRPHTRPHRVILVGSGDGLEADWRSAGAALWRNGNHEPTLHVALPEGAAPAAVRGLAEGLHLAAYRYRLGAHEPPELRQVTILVTELEDYREAMRAGVEVARATCLARELTNTPSQTKSPAWMASRIEKAVSRTPGLKVRVRDPGQLAAEGFGGVLAVGGGSDRGPRLVELSWQPRHATRHVVLVGKGVTFDTGGICIKPRDGMKLMRKDMGGAAAVLAATLGAAELGLPVRVTALAPLAENAVSGDAYRPGDVVHHYGGQTSEILNTDAEGRVIMADALAYATRRLRPDLIIDLATLTGANMVALGKRTAAMYTSNDELAQQLTEAAGAAGEQVWRMPLVDEYLEQIGSEVADIANSGDGSAGSVTAALFLREFVTGYRDRWVHFDMSAPSWADSADGPLAKGATGWGVRTLLRFLEATGGHAAASATRGPAVRSSQARPVRHR